MMRVTEYHRIEELDRCEAPWRELLLQTPDASFFQSLDWLQLYWRHFRADQQLRVLVVETSDTVRGILPLVIRSESTRAGPLRVLTYPLHDWGTFYGPIGPDTRSILTAGLRHLRSVPRDWDLLDLRWVNRDETDHGQTPAALAAAGFPCREQLWRTTAIVDFSGSWETYLQSRSSKFRNNLRRAEAAAERSGHVSFDRYRPTAPGCGDTGPKWDLFEECVQLAQRTWQGSSTDGTTLSHPAVREFFRELYGGAARAGALDLNLLRHDGQLVAFSFNLVRDGRLAGLRMGFDERAAAISPGRLLLANSLADSFRRGDRCLDLGSESMHFKQPWRTRLDQSLRYTHYPRWSWRTQLLRAKHWLWPAAASTQRLSKTPSP